MAPHSPNAEGLEVLDTEEVLLFLFHPRAEPSGASVPDGCEAFRIPVDAGVELGARLYKGPPDAPLVLYFHGNGEIASDYDEIGPLFRRCGMQLLVVDYRGYGVSDGMPAISHMMRDAVRVFEEVRGLGRKRGWTGPLIVMGRSLGSASAAEIAGRSPEAVDGLVIESGFASLGRLMGRIGLSSRAMRVFEERDLLNTDRIRRYPGPTLVIHAEGDAIIPIEQGLALYEAAGAPDKTLLRIPGAGHNDIFYRGMTEYMEAVVTLCQKAGERRSRAAGTGP